ncbi:MAG: hypothetical protein WKG07_07850 [Hymenobacter sp.]
MLVTKGAAVTTANPNGFAAEGNGAQYAALNSFINSDPYLKNRRVPVRRAQRRPHALEQPGRRAPDGGSQARQAHAQRGGHDVHRPQHPDFVRHHQLRQLPE